MTNANGARTAKYARRRAEILDVASDHINLHGLRGMTLTAVTRELGFDTSSVTYYFRRKDDLAAACLQRTLDWQLEVASRAAAQAGPAARVQAFVHEYFELHRRQRDPAVHRLALLSDMAALDPAARAPLEATYAKAFNIVRGFFDRPAGQGGRAATLIATVILFANVHWLAAWQDRYLTRDFDRVEERLLDVLTYGLAQGSPWPSGFVALESGDSPDPQVRFLHAATNLINREGYSGASVDKIAAELGVSTGSFYYHLDNKDDLVVACFERTFALLMRAREEASARGGKMGEQLGLMVASLVALQFGGASPMLRSSAYQALPSDLRAQMLASTGRITRHIAGMISDAMADGSVRPVDAVLASHVVSAAINAAADLRRWATLRDLPVAVELFCDALRNGIFAGQSIPAAPLQGPA